MALSWRYNKQASKTELYNKKERRISFTDEFYEDVFFLLSRFFLYAPKNIGIQILRVEIFFSLFCVCLEDTTRSS